MPPRPEHKAPQWSTMFPPCVLDMPPRLGGAHSWSQVGQWSPAGRSRLLSQRIHKNTYRLPHITDTAPPAPVCTMSRLTAWCVYYQSQPQCIFDTLQLAVQHWLKCNLKGMMISIFIYIEWTEHIVGAVRSELTRIDILGSVDRDKVSCMINSVDMNDSNVSNVAWMVASVDNPHPSI